MQISTERKLFLALPTLLVLVLSVGCGGGNELNLTAVSGVVTYNNEPVEGAMVKFETEGARPATGLTNASGEFVLKTFVAGDGAVVGSNKVAVMKTTSGTRTDLEEPVDEANSEDGGYDDSEEFIHHLPPQYALTRTSQLVIEVTKGMDPVELKLVD